MEQPNNPIDAEEMPLEIILEKKIESKIKKSLRNGQGDPGYTDIDVGEIPSSVRGYLLDRFNKCSLSSRFLDKNTIRINYSLH